MAAGHTPGPWFLSGVRQKVGGADTHSVVATVDGKEIIIASVWYDPRTHEGFHDAKLMASTLDLVGALLTLWLATSCGTDAERLTALSAAGDLLATIGALDALQDAEAAAAMRGTV